MRTLRFLSTAACALVALALVVSASSAAPQRAHSTKRKAGKAHASLTHRARLAAKPAAAAPTAAGMVVAVDPETGALRMPTPAEMQALYATPDDALNESGDGLVVEHHANGSVSMNLQGRFASYSVVRMGADGKLIYGCGTSQAGAMAETFAPKPASGVAEVK
jgi:hypothetical protein